MSFSTDPWIYYGYDSLGNLLSTVDQTGTNVTYFDFLNRVAQKTTVSGTVYYAYDPSSMKTLVAMPDVYGFSGSYYAYDAAARQIYTAPFWPGITPGIRPVYYAYDASGMVTQKALYGNNVITYTMWDVASRLQQLNNVNSSLNIITYMGYARDQDGNTTSTSRENGLTIYYAYDALDRMTQESWVSSAGSTIYGFYYNYDPASNRYFKFDYRNPTTPETTYWTYDARNLLTGEQTLP